MFVNQILQSNGDKNVYSNYLDHNEQSDESDEELQIALNDGRLKPGINLEINDNTLPIFNAVAMKSKYTEIQLKLPWIERLDVASEFSYNVVMPDDDDSTKKKDDPLSQQECCSDDTLSKNDIKRELCIMNQAQQSVLEGIPRIRQLNIVVDRPTDYFAQMAKSDLHMAKVSQRLQEKLSETKEKQRLRHLRQLKKLGKQTQISVELQKSKEKREFGELMKKYKKGDQQSVELLKKKIDEGGSTRVRNKPKKSKRKAKDKKYGQGGKKRGMKRNTAASSAAITTKKGKRGTFNKSKRSTHKSKRSS
ncbi:hypothetical protein GJ496_002224 [Pomphorhynchus laevis]|nr:hypothetical protein GJ496_002224 [Pomphorhynchus laevis]